MSVNPSHWKYLFVTLALCALMAAGLMRSLYALAAPPVRSVAAPLAVAAPFEILDHRPLTHEIGVDVTADITVMFNASVDGATVNTDTFAVHGGFGGLMTGTYKLTDDIVEFDPIRARM